MIGIARSVQPSFSIFREQDDSECGATTLPPSFINSWSRFIYHLDSVSSYTLRLQVMTWSDYGFCVKADGYLWDDYRYGRVLKSDE